MGQFERFWNYSLKYLSYRPRSTKELIDALKRKKAPEEVIEQIVHKLVEQQFLDDEKFVVWWVEQRTTFKPRSLRLIKMELRQKGIDKELIDETIDELPSAIDDLESAKKLIEKRLSRYKNLSRDEKFQKIARYLVSKGFSYDIIKEIFKSLDRD